MKIEEIDLIEEYEKLPITERLNLFKRIDNLIDSLNKMINYVISDSGDKDDDK